MGLYIVANIDGNVISSTDGLVWSEPFNTGINIGKVAIGAGKIVYTGSDGDGNITTPYGLWTTSAWNVAPTLVQGTNNYYFNEVHYLGNKFVAVGYQSVSPKVPAFAYSNDGENWTMGNVDPEYIDVIGDGNNLEFTDVGYNGVGYFIIGILSGEGLAGGFYTTDLTQLLDEGSFVIPENFPTDARQLVYSSYEGGESWGSWSAFSYDGKKWWSTFNEDPSQPWNFMTGWDLTEVLFYSTGLNDLAITEATIGRITASDGNLYTVWMLSTANGQVIWWPHVPAGPFVIVPEPFSISLDSVLSSGPVTISTTGDYSPLNGERITISGATGLPDINESYFVYGLGNNVYRLYSNSDLTSEVYGDSWSGSYNHNSATIKLSRGTYIDALGYGDGKFFAGNDDEQVFVCDAFAGDFNPNTTNLNWQKVEDLNDSLQYWNDVDYGDNNCNQQTYTLNLVPQHPETLPNYKFYGEGNMDTSIIIDKNGNKVSIQRTGYFDTLDGCGNRKVTAVKDGQSFDNAPQG